MAYYESRKGKLSCTAVEVFDFVTDLRNFRQFIPEGSINNWQAEKEICSFNVSMAGSVKLKIAAQEPFNKVVYAGNALMENDFNLILSIADNTDNVAEVRVSVEAELNPMLKMMADKPVIKFLEILITEMEKFPGWKNGIE